MSEINVNVNSFGTCIQNLRTLKTTCDAIDVTEISIVGSGDCVNILKPEETMTITFPESFFSLSGSSPEEELNGLLEFGPEYCTSAKVVDGGLVIEVTQKQRDKILEYNNDNLKSAMTSFFDFDPEYSYQGSSDYTNLSFYFDEKIPSFTLATTVSLAIGIYSYNSILMNNTEDWSLHLTIYNCHTKKIVAEGILPKDEINFGPDEWEESYAE